MRGWSKNLVENYAITCKLPLGQAHGPAPTGMASGVLTIPKAFGFEAATQSKTGLSDIYQGQSNSATTGVWSLGRSAARGFLSM